MQNPYNNGRKTSKAPYQRLHDPTVSNGMRPINESRASSPADYSQTFPEPASSLQSSAGRRYSYVDDNVSGYAESVGAQNVQPYHGQSSEHQPFDQHQPYEAPQQYETTQPYASPQIPEQAQPYEQGYDYQPYESRYEHPSYQDGSYQSNAYREPIFQDPSYQDPSYQDPLYQGTSYQGSSYPEPSSYQPASYPTHTSTSAGVPWDANAINPETLLIGKSSGNAPTTRKRGSSFAGSFKKFFDPESQSTLGRSTSFSRANSVRHIFGMQREPTINEYADDEELDQIPISGDEYQLNTWAPTNNNARGRYRQRGGSVRSGGDYMPEDDISHGYENYGSGYGDDPLHPWSEEGENAEYADDFEKSGEYTGSESGSQGEDETAMQTIELFRGNLVLDCPVSTQLLDQYPEHRPVREFTHMRYTAATCDPADFVNDQYTLRQMCYTQPRDTELCICVTVYNEDDVLLGRTLQGVFNNIRHLCHRNRSSVWGVNAWKKVVVCIVADGRDKLNPRAKALMAALGVYQEGFAKNMVNDRAVEAHLYEYTSMVRIQSVSDKEGVKLTTEKATPVQLLFCMKEKNKKKINSHRWFFQAFGEVLKPKVCVLLDSGTRPGNHAIYHLWKSFHRNPRVAGACGEIAAMLGPGGRKLVNPLVATQNFEYKMSNILDKPSESIFGFITVLPGAFSAYRYEALQNHPNGSGPLEKYFKGEKLEGKGSIFQANMYLAEDRILCWELVSKRNADWLLTYVKSAKAHTDVPEGLSELILQRRRWLNGSFFAQIYSLTHAFAIWRSGHSVGRKLAFHIQFFYQILALIFSWFSLGNFFLVFHILVVSVGDKSAHFAPGKILGIVLTWIYAACILTAFILSFGNRPQGTKRFYDLMVVFFSLLMAYIVFVTIYISVKGIQYAICANGGRFEAKLLWTNSTFRDLIVSLLCTYALYLLSSLLFLDPWHVFTSMIQYVLLSPSYVNIMNVYAFCNTHDISWGTKGDTTQKLDLGVAKADEAGKLELELPTSTELVDKYYLNEVETLSSEPPKMEPHKLSEADKRPDYYALVRSMNVLVWVIMNVALVAVVLNIGGFQTLIGKDNSNPGTNSSPTGNSNSNSNNNGGNTGSSPAGIDIPGFSKVAIRATEATCQELSSGGTRESQIYMAVIFWAVAFMAAYRFLLSVLYLFVWTFRAV